LALLKNTDAFFSLSRFGGTEISEFELPKYTEVPGLMKEFSDNISKIKEQYHPVEFAEQSLAIGLAGHQAAIVEALVILGGHEQSARPRFALDRQRVAGLEDQRLNAQDILIGGQRGHDRFEMQVVGQGHHDEIARRHVGDHLTEQRRMRRVGFRVQRRKWDEGLAGEGAGEAFGLRQFAQRPRIQGADGDLPDRALALQVIERRKDLIVGDHAAANDQHDDDQ